MATDELLRPLDDLAYLIECAALDYCGELKTELSHLCAAIETQAEGYAAEPVQRELKELQAALVAYRADQKGAGASKLIAISRRWWRLARFGPAA
ncbi:MAG: hypothetical protein EON58_17530 [Alphaproteobacteria bacterium]|nr:MAG: hypothetical protein EON58_17530 [Alphaproteobacteria bacterium]